MAHSREARVPFLDKKVMEFAFQLPENYIIKEGLTKLILRNSMKGIVPNEILDRKDKIGFATPEKKWLKERGIQKIMKKWFKDVKPLCSEFINLNKTNKYIDEHANGKKNHARILWRTLFLEAWFRAFKANLV